MSKFVRAFAPLAFAVAMGGYGLTASGQYVTGASLIDPGLSGTTEYNGWIGLTSVNYAGYGGFPGSGAWPASIGSNRTATNGLNLSEPGDAVLRKVANGTGGGPYLASGSIYYGGFSGDINNDGGTLAVRDETPVAGLQTVTFQIEIGEAWGFDFYDPDVNIDGDELPTLVINDGAMAFQPTSNVLLQQFHNGTVEMPTGPEDVYINTYLLTYDLSSVVEEIELFEVQWNGVQHAQLYGLRLDQSDVAVPEPGAIGLIACAGAMLLGRRRRAR